MAQRTAREIALLSAAALAAVTVGYVTFRLRPNLREIAAVQSEADQASASLGGIRWPIEPAERPDDLKRELQEIEIENARERTRLTEVGRQFAPTDEDVRQLNVEISSLAEACQVRIKQSRPLETPGAAAKPAAPKIEGDIPMNTMRRPGTATQSGAATTPAVAVPAANWSAPFVDPKALASFRNRPLERMELESSFMGLRLFLEGLARLPWRVTVVEMDVAMGQRPDGYLRYPVLRTTLVLSL